MDAGPLAECGGSRPNINGDVKDFSGNDMDQLCLGVFDLKMEPSYGAFQGIRKIILNKNLINTGLDISALVVCFHKKTTLILECLWLNDKNTLYGCGDDVHALLPFKSNKPFD
jgi:hypothetical protein